MNILEDKPFRCYHKQLQAVFEIVAIDWLTRQVKVIKSTINNGTETNPDHILDSFSFDDVKILQFTEKLDNNKREIYEGNILAYGEKLAYMGVVKFNHAKGRWVLENISGNGPHDAMYFLSEISPQYLHIIENNGRSME